MFDSMKPKCRRVTALILACTLLVFCFCGCKKDDTPEETTTAPETTGTAPVEETAAPTTPSEPVLYTGTVKTGELNVREGVGVEYEVVTTLMQGTTVEIYETADLKGVPWGRTIDGWICLAYVKVDGAETRFPTKEPYEITEPISGTIIATELNVRSGPGTNYKVTKTLKSGQIVIVSELDGNWGKTEDGWVNTFFVYFQDSMDAESLKVEVLRDGVNVRTGPGTGYQSITKVNEGDELTILKQVVSKDILWGYTGDGWLCMDYVKESSNG